MVAAGVEVGLEVVGVALAVFGSVAFGEAVAEADDDGAVVVCWSGLGSGFRCGRFGGGRGFGGVDRFGWFFGVVGFAAG